MNAPRTLREFRAQGRDPFAVFRASDVLAIDGEVIDADFAAGVTPNLPAVR